MHSVHLSTPEDKGSMPDDAIDRAFQRELRTMGTLAIGRAVDAARRTGKVLVEGTPGVELPCVLRATTLICLAHFPSNTPVGVVIHALENADLPPAHIWRVK